MGDRCPVGSRRPAMLWRAAVPSFGNCQQRLAFFHDVGGKFGRLAAADVLDRMDAAGRDEQHVAGLERHRGLPVELVLQHAFDDVRSEEHTSELQSLMRISYAVFCLKKKKTKITLQNNTQQ